jgi:hypothetical protein
VAAGDDRVKLYFTRDLSDGAQRVTERVLTAAAMIGVPDERHRAIKYGARPCKGESGERPSDAADDYMRDAMADQRSDDGACFEFVIQHQTDPETMPIEAPTYEWSETVSPFIPVGRITIPKQGFLSAERQKTCENPSFTPWHSRPEHRPFGGINRVRRLVYETISAVRQALTEAPEIEPTALPEGSAN